jgi:hypothetical protein
MTAPKSAFLSAMLVLCMYTNQVTSYGTGAPASEEICTSMKPGHGADPQTSPSPFAIQLSSSNVRPGQKIQVTIKSLDGNTSFMGFLILGKRVLAPNGNSPKGTFVLDSNDSQNAKITDCFDIKGSSITHTNNSPKKEVTFEWQVPILEGRYVLIGTVVQSFTIFWTNVESETITVKGTTTTSTSSGHKTSHHTSHHRRTSTKAHVAKAIYKQVKKSHRSG